MNAPRLETRPRIATDASIAFVLMNEHGEVVRSRKPHKTFYAASTIKVHILIAVLTAVDRGEIKLADAFEATRTFKGCDGESFELAGDHIDAEFPSVGSSMTLAEVLRAMIARSSNEATNMSLSALGNYREAIDSVCQRVSITNTKVERLIGDAKAVQYGRTNETSAFDLAQTMRALVSGKLLSEESTRFALDSLRTQEKRLILSTLRDGVDAGSKSGEIDNIQHDVAFVGAPPWVLAIMTEGMAADDSSETIAALSHALLPSHFVTST